MEATERQQRNGRSRAHAPEPRVVAIEYRPAPDAEERLRRIATILFNLAARTASPPADGEARESG